MGVSETGHPLRGGGERDPVSGLAGADSEAVKIIGWWR
jgi:hypothetical protein